MLDKKADHILPNPECMHTRLGIDLRNLGFPAILQSGDGIYSELLKCLTIAMAGEQPVACCGSLHAVCSGHGVSHIPVK